MATINVSDSTSTSENLPIKFNSQVQAFDDLADFATSTVLVAPSPGDTGTTLTVQPGDGVNFPNPPFNAVVGAPNVVRTKSNSVAIRVTSTVDDTFTFTRATSENTGNRTIAVGDVIFASVTQQTLQQIERSAYWPRTGGRLLYMGHSYTTAPDGISASPRQVFGFPPNQLERDHIRWTEILPELLGISDAKRFVYAYVPPVTAGNDQNTIIHMPTEDSMIEAVSYLPNSAITGQNTNTRNIAIQVPTPLSWQTIGFKQFNSGSNYVFGNKGGLENILTSLARCYKDSSGNYISFAPMAGVGQWINWVSTHVGTGMADPGGVVVMRLGNRIRNVALGGSQAGVSGIYQGGWASGMFFRPPSEAPGFEVCVTTTANAGDVTIACDSLMNTIGNGTVIRFANGATATLSAQANAFDTSLTVNSLAAQIPAGQQGWSTNTATGSMLEVSPSYLPIFLWGINDCGAVTFDTSAWRESMRAAIAMHTCPYYKFGAGANVVTTAGNGTNAAWANYTGPNAGQLPNTAVQYTGGIGATPPSITIYFGPAFEGGTVDLFFYALAGSNHGGAATITVGDGTGANFTNPPNGACTISTSGVSPTQGVSNSLVVTTTTSSANIVATSGGFSDPLDRGKLVTGTGIPAGTYISSVTDSTHAVLSQAITGTGQSNVSVSAYGYIPMVKRLTGLSPGSLSIKITLTGMDANDGTAQFLYAGYGWEANAPTAGAIVCNIPKIYNTTTYAVGNTDANVNTANQETINVLNGTAAVVGSNSVEPAFPSSVVLADLSGIFDNKNPQYYINDGIHPNARGHMNIARAIYRAIQSNLDHNQTVAR